MKGVLTWSGIIAIGVVTVIIMSYAASMESERMELERPDLIKVEEDK